MKVSLIEKKNAFLLASSLQNGEPLAQHFLSFFQRILLGDKRPLSQRQTFAEIGGVFQNDNFGRPVGAVELRYERAQEFKRIAQIHPPLALHAVVLTSLLARILRVGTGSGRTFARRTRSARSARSFTRFAYFQFWHQRRFT